MSQDEEEKTRVWASIENSARDGRCQRAKHVLDLSNESCQRAKHALNFSHENCQRSAKHGPEQLNFRHENLPEQYSTGPCWLDPADSIADGNKYASHESP